MSEEQKSKTGFFLESAPSQEKTIALLGRLFDLANNEAVFSEPVNAGDHTVITAADISVGMGAGFGGGGGISPSPESGGEGSGGGGGGGGAAAGRPVAAVIIGPDGVRVEPIVDVTKIALAFFTMMATIFTILRKARRDAARLERD
jgi:uncharacterized spore protein YtfJ